MFFTENIKRNISYFTCFTQQLTLLVSNKCIVSNYKYIGPTEFLKKVNNNVTNEFLAVSDGLYQFLTVSDSL